MTRKLKIALAAALVVGFAAPALAETSDYAEYLANSGRTFAPVAARPDAFASMPTRRVTAPRSPDAAWAEKARFDRASEVH